LKYYEYSTNNFNIKNQNLYIFQYEIHYKLCKNKLQFVYINVASY